MSRSWIGRRLRSRVDGELRFAVAGTIGNWLGRLGERVSVEALMLNGLRFADWHHRSLETAPVTIDGLLSLYPSTRDAIDLGCGTGVYVNELRRRGVRATGYEHAAAARRTAKRVFGLDVRPFEIDHFETETTFDLCLCLEVAHYLTVETADILVAHCARTGRLVAFSASHVARSRRAGTRNRQDWIARFEAAGMHLCVAETGLLERHLRSRLTRNLWLAENLCLFSH